MNSLVMSLYLAMASSFQLSMRQERNNGIQLAITPVCRPLSGPPFDTNAGINLSQVRTIVAFGDSFSDGGKWKGEPLSPPVVIPPHPSAGGRSTNGKLWLENIADDINATLKDYAQTGAVSDVSLWPSFTGSADDFIGQTNTFLGQSDDLDPKTTLYSIFFGINDYGWSAFDGPANLQPAAEVILSQIRILASPPTNARSFLVADCYGRGKHTPAGDAFVQTIHAGLNALHLGENSTGTGEAGPKLNVAFVLFSRIWDAVLGQTPGYRAFGYVSPDKCIFNCSVPGCSTVGMCEDPDHTFQYFGGHPSKETMRIMADYAERVIVHCVET